MLTLQGLQVGVVGNVGRNHAASSSCSITGINVAIYAASATGQPTTQLHSASIDMSQTATNFTWSTNESSVMVFDMFSDSGGMLVPLNSSYWVQLQLIVPYGGNDGSGQCLAFVGTSSTTGNPSMQARWQESGGFTTSCTGAGASLPGSSQVCLCVDLHSLELCLPVVGLPVCLGCCA